uniref:Reverse transcriptase Ty1/copia-type domain-containing protein n=1 Tax=Tanacetum cinerariifolium TaxID=118510 RepID=A0A6L2KQR9_TANCI|nr:hypothetical protein [Tanacetum cinerariifolium]
MQNKPFGLNIQFKLMNPIFLRDIVSSSESAPTFAELFETNELKAQIQEKNTVILKLKKKIKSLSADDKERKKELQTDEPNLSASTTIVEVPRELPKVSMQMELAVEQHCEEKNKFQNKMENVLQENDRLLTHALSIDIVNLVLGDVNERKVKREVEEIETLNIELDHKVTKLVAENEHLRQTYKQLYDSIKSLRVRSKEQCDDLINKVNLKSAEVSDLNASLQEKVLVDVAPLALKLRKNRTAHTDYIRHTQEEAATLREIVESKKLLNPLNTSLDYACKYTRQIQELLIILQQTYPCLTDLGTKLVAVTPKNKTKQIRLTEQITKSGKTTVTTPPSANVDSNTPVLSSTGVTLNAFSLPHVPMVTPIDDTGIFGNAYDDDVLEAEALVNLPKDKWAIGTKWVYRNTKDEKGIVIKNKARLVAQGFCSLPNGCQNAFLDGKIKEEVYVCQPPGFEDPNFLDKVYKVEKALYGQHQAPRAWYETLLTYLLDNGFHRGQIDKTLCIKRHKDDILLVQVYVYDIIFGSTKKELSTDFEKLMHDKFQMSSMGELSFFLGLQVKQKSDGIFISQDKYVAEILKKFDFVTVKAVTSRPDITFAVCACTRFQVTPKTSHLHAMKRIFRYLKGQPKLGLWYPKDSPFDLEAYSDSDYARASLDRKSTTGAKDERCFVDTSEVTTGTTLLSIVGLITAGQRVNDQEQIQALVEKKKVPITKDNIRSDLCFDDAEGGAAYLPNEAIFEGLACMCNTMASVIICLADNQKFNFSKYIFDNMVKSLEGRIKFYLFLRFLQVFLDKQVKGMARRKEMYVISSHTKKIFANVSRIGAGFSGVVTPLFETMMVQAAADMEDEDHIPIPSSDLLPSGEDSYTLHELMVFCTNLQEQVFDLQEGKDGQSKEIAALKKKVFKLLKWRKSRSGGLRRLMKIGLEIDQDDEIALDVETQGRTNDDEMFGVNDLSRYEVVTIVADKVSVAPTTDSVKPKVVVQEQDVITTVLAAATKVTTVVPTLGAKGIVFMNKSHIPIVSSLKDKGKANMIMPEVPIKKKDQIRMDEEYAKQLEAEEQEAARLSRAQQDEEANISWDNTQAMMKANSLLAERLQAKEREEFSKVQKARLLVELFEKRKKHFAALRAQEKRNKPPTKAQIRSQMCTYLRNIVIDDTKELKKCMEIVHGDGDDVLIKATPISSRSPTIIDYKIHKEGKKNYFKIIRADGNSKVYQTFEKIFMNFNREDIEVLWAIVKDRFKKEKPMNDMDNILFKTLKTMFEHHVEDTIWTYQQGLAKVKNWKLFESYGVYYITM